MDVRRLLNTRRAVLGKDPVWLTRFNRPLAEAIGEAPDMLPGDIRHPDRAALVPAVTIPDEGINFTTVVSQLERELILRSLEKTFETQRGTVLSATRTQAAAGRIERVVEGYEFPGASGADVQDIL